MKSTRKLVAAGLAVATMFGTLGLAGCGSSGDAAQEENPTSIKIWHYEEDNGAQGKAWAKAMEIFEEETGVKVESKRSPSNRSVRTPLRSSTPTKLRTLWNTTRATPPQAYWQARGC